MLKAESEWVGDQLDALAIRTTGRILNLGSSTAAFAGSEQPWVDDNVVERARAAGFTIVNVDRKPEPGVDLVGDLLDPDFREEVAAGEWAAVMCCNVLEHLEDRALLTGALESLVTQGARLIVTCPLSFPYHPDPIDTMYRPRPAELAAEFPSLEVIEATVVRCRRYGWYRRRYLEQAGVSTGRDLLATVRGLLRHPSTTSAELKGRWARTSVSCVVLAAQGLPTAP